MTPGLSAALRSELLAAQRRGAIGPAAIEQHISHALALAEACPEMAAASSLLDLGSGGGIPGLVLAAALAVPRIVLLEGRETRAAALAAAVERLGWTGRVEVIAERAEVAGRRPELREGFAVVVARSFASPAATAECGAPLVVVGGVLVVSDPPTDSPGRWPPPDLAELGLSVELAIRGPVALTVLRKRTATSARFPRRVGVPEKRPLF